ncbi:MAG: aldo/keto reductase [Candidatus Marinimicrobia bacterium]|nr:aldo/keto reductase [Candidatus Neomarinimicrobiota bacterium]
MKYTNLGRSGLKVSRLCLGTMNFGPHTTEKDSFAILDHALDQGLNFIDTADVYGWKIGEGITEQIIGRWLDQGGRREKIVLATKVYGSMGKGINDRGLSAYHIIQACESSLKRLKTDHIDLYQMHHVDRSTPWDEIWQAMEVLVQQGKVLYVGSSNFAAIDIVKAQYEAKSRHFLGLVSEQSLYNLNTRAIELELVPACLEYGVGLIPWSPLGGGLLGGVLTSTNTLRRQEDSRKELIQKHLDQIQRYEKFCSELGKPPGQVALAWLLSQPAVTAPIIGPRTMDQFTDALKAIELELSDEDQKSLDEIWPGPGGHAPEAYAW